MCGLPIIKEAIEALIHEKDIKTDLLVSIAIISSTIIGELFASGVIALIMTIGGFLEEYTVSKTQNEIKNLINITPTTATLIKDNNTEKKINAKDIKTNDIIKVLPGEIIPGDGIIIDGNSSINQTALTGESLPVDKSTDDEVFSGTINLYGSIIIKATKNGEKSSVNQLIKLIESSKPENAKIVKASDKYSKKEIIHILASLENKSEHPLAKSIVKYYKNHENKALKEVNDFEIIPGTGVKGKIRND